MFLLFHGKLKLKAVFIMTPIEQGCIDIWIDEIVPCLKDTQAGEVKEKVVFKI